MKLTTEHSAIDLLEAILDDVGPIRVLEHVARHLSVHGAESEPQPGRVEPSRPILADHDADCGCDWCTPAMMPTPPRNPGVIG